MKMKMCRMMKIQKKKASEIEIRPRIRRKHVQEAKIVLRRAAGNNLPIVTRSVSEEWGDWSESSLTLRVTFLLPLAYVKR